MKNFTLAFLFLISIIANAQSVKSDEIKKEVVRVLDSINNVNKVKQTEKEKADKESWYNKLAIRGYVFHKRQSILRSM
jgi:hypothetical protein